MSEIINLLGYYYTEDEIDALINSKLNKSEKIPPGPDLDHKTDLNDYIEGGFYYCNKTAEAAYITNAPENNKAFWLMVEDWGETNYTKQTCTIMSNKHTYIRIRAANVWGDWIQFSQDGHNHDNDYIQKGTGTVTSINILDGTIVNGDIANSTIETSKIKDSAITSAKIANGTIVNTDIADATIETGKIKDSAITSAKIANGTIVNEDISDATITGAKFVDGTITSTQLANNSVTTNKITDLNVTTAKIANLGVTTAKIADANITEAKIANSSITSAKIVNGTILNEDIADGTIKGAKLDNGTISTDQLATSCITTAKITDNAVKLAKLNSDVFDSTDGGTNNGIKLITSGAVYNGLSVKEDVSNKTTSWNSTTNNTRYPTEKLVKDSLDAKANSSHSHGNILTGGTMTSSDTSTVFTNFAGINSSNKLIKANKFNANNIIDSNSGQYSNIGIDENNKTQKEINEAINTRIGQKEFTLIDTYDLSDANYIFQCAVKLYCNDSMVYIKFVQNNASTTLDKDGINSQSAQIPFTIPSAYCPKTGYEYSQIQHVSSDIFGAVKNDGTVYIINKTGADKQNVVVSGSIMYPLKSLLP